MKITKSFFRSLALASILLPSSFLQAGPVAEKWSELKNSLEPAKIEQKIKDKITSLDIGFDLDLIDLDLFDGAGLAAKYRYEVEPGYHGDWYTRVDKWKVRAKLSPGDFLSEHDLPIGFLVENNAEFVFVRQFKSQKEALTARPYHPGRTPVNAERALEKLNPGDFVAIPARLNLLISANLGAQSGVFHAGLGTHYLLSGEFQVQVFRLPEDKVRLKLIALRKRQHGASGNAKMDFEIFGVSIVDKQIKKFLGLDFAQVGLDKEQGNLFLMDYVLDLKTEEGREAYNQVLNGSIRFKQAEVLNPFLQNKEVEETVLANLSMAEALHEEDLEKPSEERRVERIFKGLNDYDRVSSRLKLGLSLARFENKKAYTRNRMAWYDQNDQRHDFLYPIYSHEKKRSFLFGVFKAQELESFSALFPTDSNGSITGFSDYGYSYELKDKAFFGHEQEELKEKLSILLPKNHPIEFGEWTEETKRENARVKVEVFLHENALPHLNGLSEDDLYLGLASLLPRLQKLTLNNQGGKPGSHQARPGAGWKASDARKTAHKAMLKQNYDRFWRSMCKMVERLAEILQDQRFGSEEKVEQLFELRKNSAFEKLGFALLIRMLPETELKQLVYVSSDWVASGTKGFHLRFGEHRNSALYEELKWVESILNDRRTDLNTLPPQNPAQEERDEARRQLFEELYDEQ